jgi:hypothetical protein
MKSHHRLMALLLLLLALGMMASRVLGAQGSVDAARGSDPREAAASARDVRIVVSIAHRRLWVVRDSADTLLSAPVAVGSGRTLRLGSRAWRFNTPRGIRSVLSKETDPAWIRPDWGYVEVARAHHFRLDSVSAERPRPLADGAQLVVRGRLVGVEKDSVFVPWPVDDEIVIDGTLYIPPFGTEHRSLHGQLGAYRLNLGDGVGIHGTPDHDSIGHAVTHGCMRLGDDDLAWLYANVAIGTRVYIY